MKDLFSASWQLLLSAGWAPALVLVVHRVVAMTRWRQPLDFWMHFSGGLAAAYLAWHASRHFERWIGSVTLVGRILFSYAAACTIGVFWEFAELASDVFRGTHIQHDLHETMRDLIADACGAAVTVSLMAWRAHAT